MNTEITAQAAREIEASLLVFFVSSATFANPAGPAAALADALAKNPFTLAGEEGFKGKPKQNCMLRAPEGIAAKRLLLVGVGDGEVADAGWGGPPHWSKVHRGCRLPALRRPE